MFKTLNWKAQIQRERRKKKWEEGEGVKFDLEDSTHYSITLLTPRVSFRKQD